MLHQIACSTLLMVCVTHLSVASAQTPDAATADFSPALIDTLVAAVHDAPPASHAAAGPAAAAPASWRGRTTMGSLYATTVLTQALDADSTLKALGRGGVEMNPIMALAAKNRALFIAAKAGGAATTIWAAHRASKRHRTAAILTLVVLNGAYAVIIHNNYRIAGR